MQDHGTTNPPADDSTAAETIDSFTLGYVKKAARKLVGKHGFTKSDCDDLVQQVLLKLINPLRNADHNDPKWKALVAMAAKRCLANAVRDKQAQKRDYRRVCSLHVVIGEDEDGPLELGATITEETSRSHRSVAQRGQHEAADLIMDVAACLADLGDEKHRDVCERLKHAPISQVAEDLGIPRTTIGAMLRSMRQQFEDFGLREYL